MVAAARAREAGFGAARAHHRLRPAPPGRARGGARGSPRALGAERHIVLPLDLRAFGGSALTDDIDVPKGGVERRRIPVTYVPARNTIFLSLALGWAEAAGARDLFIGVNALDYSGYPDCRPDFIAAFEHLATLATKAGRRRRALHRSTRRSMHMTKADIAARGGAARPRRRHELVLLRSGAGRPALRPLRQLPAARARASRKPACPIRRRYAAHGHELRRQGDVPDPAGGGHAGRPPRRLPALRRLQPLDRAASRTARPRLHFCDTDFVGTDGVNGGRYEAGGAGREGERACGGSGERPLVVVTGGEPMLQLDAPLIDALHAGGFEIAVETNGTLPAPAGIDWICVSPKAGTEVVQR